MASMEPHRTRAYNEDLNWRMVYERLMLGLTYQQVAKNLSVDNLLYGERWTNFRLKELSTVRVLKTLTDF